MTTDETVPPTPRRTRRCVGSLDAKGLTLVEVMVYLVCGGLILTSVHQVMTRQQRAQARQHAHAQANMSIRTVVSLVASELRAISPSEGDLISMGTSSIAFRSVVGSGFVCDRKDVGPQMRVVVADASGELLATPEDSLFLFSAGEYSSADDEWNLLKIDEAKDKSDKCVWDGVKGDYRLDLSGDRSGIRVGAPIRAFRVVEYGMVADGGRWWLGRRMGGAGPLEPIVGPLVSAADGGLSFGYYDAAGNPTTIPSDVTMVEIQVRADRAGTTSGRSSVGSLTTRAYLRGV